MQLPVFRTVGQVFGFVVELRFFTLLRIIWFPALLSVLSSLMQPLYMFHRFGVLPQQVNHQVVSVGIRMQELDADPILGTMQVVDTFLQLVLGAIIAVSVHRIILKDDEQPGEFFYLRFTGEELRYVFCGIFYSLLFCIAVLLPFAGHFYWQATHAGTVPLDLDRWEDPALVRQFMANRTIFPVAVVAAMLGLISLARFGLAFPIIVAEGRLSFIRSWVLTRGNTLRLIAFWILTTILAMILILALFAVVGAAVAGMWLSITAGGQTGGALGILVLSAPAAAAALTYLVIGLTLFIAAMSFSYKALAEGDEG